MSFPLSLPVAAPEILIAPESVDVLNSTTAMLTCVARGDPPPTVTWEHNGEAVDPDSDSRISILDNGTLTITMVTMTDMGNYQCIAINSLGSTDSDIAMLMVQGQL